MALFPFMNFFCANEHQLGVSRLLLQVGFARYRGLQGRMVSSVLFATLDTTTGFGVLYHILFNSFTIWEALCKASAWHLLFPSRSMIRAWNG